jgi:putative ABC transport system permease protein
MPQLTNQTHLWRDVFAAVLFSLRAAVEAVGHNRLRAALTSLGILFGVASVIAMLAIGKGAEQEILAQMKLLGANNIVVAPVIEQKEEQAKDEGMREPKLSGPLRRVGGFRDQGQLSLIVPAGGFRCRVGR